MYKKEKQLNQALRDGDGKGSAGRAQHHFSFLPAGFYSQQ